MDKETLEALRKDGYRPAKDEEEHNYFFGLLLSIGKDVKEQVIVEIQVIREKHGLDLEIKLIPVKVGEEYDRCHGA